MSVPSKRFLGNYNSHYHQTWHGNGLRHVNASSVNYIDLDFHSRSYRHYSESIQVMPIKFAVKIVRLYVYFIFSQSDDIDLQSRSEMSIKVDIFFNL